MITAFTIGMAGCKSTKEATEQPKAEVEVPQSAEPVTADNSIYGIYNGYTGDSKNKGAIISLTLQPDGYYLVKVSNSREAKGTLSYNGKYSLKKPDNILQLVEVEPVEVPELYKIADGKLLAVEVAAGDGSGPLELVKAGSDIGNTYWKLITINKKPVRMQEGDQREAHLVFHTASGKLSGSTGCNTIMGFFEQPAPNEIRILNVGSTKMACPDMKLEQEMLQILPRVDQFSIQGDTLLWLMDKAGTPVAEFRSVALQ